MVLRINVPPITRALLVLFLVFTLLFHLFKTDDKTKLDARASIGLTPQLVLFRPWTLVTATFAETSVITLLIASATVFFGGKYLERAWGSAEFGKFLLVVTVIPNLAATFLYLIVYVIMRSDTSVLATLQGSIALQAAFLVAFKQLVPEHTVTILKGLIKIRVKHFTAIFLALNTISGILWGTDGAATLSWIGFFSSWIYLRFYKRQQDLSGTSTGGSMLRGDASDTFAFAYFWPDVVHGPIAAVSEKVFDLLVALSICTPFSQEAVETSNQEAHSRGEGGLPSLMNPGGRPGGGGKREDTERRRALALKALDQRLQAASANRAQAPAAAPPLTPSNPGAATSSSGPVSEQQDESVKV